MSPSRITLWFLPILLLIGVAISHRGLAANEPVFFRGINLNGPATRIDGHDWEAESTTNLVLSGKSFENQQVPLRPATDPSRSRMIRSSRWGSRVDVSLTSVPPGTFQVFAYVWEDNHSEQFDLLLNGRVVAEKFHSGAAGSWQRLGPWPLRLEGTNTQITLSARGPGHGAANLSGIEVWSGAGTIPSPEAPRFAGTPSAEQVAFFESRIRPVLVEHCYECHSAQSAKLKGGLLLDSRAGVIRGGDSGPIIAPGDPEA
ncbi:MAG: c-type cytochrome domain-containing protein, partial [Limisphaerales bacterium]